MKKILLSFLGTALAALSAHAAGPGDKNDFGGKRVLVIGIDGLRCDALQQAKAPNMKNLMAHGVTTWTAQAGGELGGETQQPTISGPGWTSILTGTCMNRHNVAGNGTEPHDSPKGYQVSKAPHFAKWIKQKFPSASISSISSWGWIETYLLKGQESYFDVHSKSVGANYPARDADVLAKVLACLKDTNPDVLFVHFDQVDGAGHGTGFDVKNPVYMNAIETVDAHIGEVMKAMKERPDFKRENWLVLLTSDHGGIGKSHGGQSAEERTIPFIVSGKDVAHGRVENSTPGHFLVPTIAMRYLGMSIDPEWGLEPGGFGLPPYLDAKVSNNKAQLRWTSHPSAKSVKGISIKRDGVVVKTLPANATGFEDMPPADGEPHVYEVVFDGTQDVRDASVTLERPADVTSGLVLHLPLDGDVVDKSGRNNKATAVGTTYVVDGKIGKAAVLNATSSISLGSPDDLKFGAATDFTVSFWLRSSAPWAKDPAVISNKSWSNGASAGWIIAGVKAKQAWQWNFKGTDAPRKDFTPSTSRASLTDGDWHLVTVTHKRNGKATFYHDGAVVGLVSIKGAGDIDTANPIRIGRDGLDAFPFDVDLAIDDVRIWRRALNRADVGALYAGAKR